MKFLKRHRRTEFVAWMFGEAGAEEQSRCEHHIAHCPQCARFVADTQKILGAPKPVIPEPDDRMVTAATARVTERIGGYKISMRKKTVFCAKIMIPAFASLFFLALMFHRYQRTLDIAAHFHLYRDLPVITCLDQTTEDIPATEQGNE